MVRPICQPTLGSTSGGRTDASASPILAPVPPSAIINGRLLELYRSRMLPEICEDGDDGNHGSTAVQDVQCLQTVATRIYYGLFVAESKFRSETEKATALIQAKDRAGLMNFITKPDVEERNIQRVILKARTFSQNIISMSSASASASASASTSTAATDIVDTKINPEFVGEVMRKWVMPLTKDVEVEYLLSRLDHHTAHLKSPRRRSIAGDDGDAEADGGRKAVAAAVPGAAPGEAGGGGAGGGGKVGSKRKLDSQP